MIDASSLTDLRRCPEYYRLRHELGYRLDYIDPAPSSGTALHYAWYKWFGSSTSNAVAAMAALGEAWPNDPKFDLQDEKRPYSLFKDILTKYMELYPREDDPFEVIANEYYTSARIVNHPTDGLRLVNEDEFSDIDWEAIIDRVIRFDDKSEYIMDGKSTSLYLSQNYFNTFTLGAQLRGNMALRLVNGHRCDGYYIDAVHVDTRYKKVHDKYFQRHGPVRVPDWKLTQWAFDVESDLEHLEDLRGFLPSGRWPQYEQGCIHYNRQCPFFQVCNEPPELMQETLDMRYIIDKWDPKEVASAKRERLQADK